MRILVTGGTGFIGSHVVEQLLAEGHELRVMAHSAALSPELSFIGQHTELILGDLSDKSTLQRALQSMEALVHLAWSTVPGNATADPVFDVQSNVIGTLHLLEQAKAQKLKKFVFISSGGTVYGVPEFTPITESHPTNPLSAYGLSKLTVEKYLHLYEQLYGLDYTVLRVANAYGERQNLLKGQGVVGVWLHRVSRGETIEIWGDGSVIRDYVYVRDIARAVSQAVSTPSATKILNIGSGRGYSLKEVLEAIRGVVKQEFAVRYLPGRSFDVASNVLDIGLAAQRLGWQPETNFSEGVARVWAWMQENL